MTASELLDHVRKQGVRLWVDSGQVRYRAPRDVLTEALRAQLAAHKSEILALLRATSSRGDSGASVESGG